LSPAGRNWAAIQPPLQKDDSTLRLAYSALELSPWAMQATAARCGEPWTPGAEPTWPAQAFSSIVANVPCAGQRYCAAISGALSTLAPNVDGVAGRIQRSEATYHRCRRPAGLSNRARRTPPFVAGRCLRDGRQRWGSVHSGATSGPLGSGERPVLTQVRSMGACGIRFSHA